MTIFVNIKNNLLKNEFVDEALYDIYNEQMVITGANIIFLRKKFLREIQKIASLKHKIISDTEDFGFNYTCPGDEIEEICEHLKQELQEQKL